MKSKLPGKLLIPVMSIGLLQACDGSLTVSGNIIAAPTQGETSCEITLWSLIGPAGGRKKPTVMRSAIVQREFRVHWTIGGPEADHWIQVACPGHRLFRSPKFLAPSTTRERDFGDIVLVPASHGGQ